MDDRYGTDLMLVDDDLVIEDGDLKLVSGLACLSQDLGNAFLTGYYFWGMDHTFGSRMSEFIEGTDAEDFYIVELKKAIIEVFRNEPRVRKDSWKIYITAGDESLEIKATYLPLGGAQRQTITIEAA